MNGFKFLVAEKRALQYKQQKIKQVKVTNARNSFIRALAFILPLMVIVLFMADFLGREDRFTIKEIEYKGEFVLVDQQLVDQATKDVLIGNFFTVNLEQIKSTLEQLNWVRSVDVDKRWPSKVSISIKEYKPEMRWYSGGWVVKSGELVNLPISHNSSEYDNLPILHGHHLDVALLREKFDLWQNYLLTENLKILRLDRSDSNSWIAYLQNQQQQFQLRLGSSNKLEQRLQQFLSLYHQNPEHFQALEYVDARYPNGVAIKVIESAEEIEEQIQEEEKILEKGQSKEEQVSWHVEKQPDVETGVGTNG